MYRPGRIKVTPEEIIPVLNDAGVQFVLMDTHAMGGWRSEPRATDDVDFLVQPHDHRKAIRAIKKAFPKLKMRDLKAVTRFYDPATKIIVIDLMKPLERVHQEVFRHCVPAGKTYQIPDLEMALVCKFAAMVSPNRVVKKRSQDIADFMDIVDENREIIDMRKIRRLTKLVCPDGGRRIAQIIKDIDADRIPRI
jgi:hypothetical protein